MQPGNPIVGGTALRIPRIQSPDFVTGVTGWSINQDGTAEFNGLTLHGTLVLGTGTNNVIILDFARRAVFVYDNSGKLISSIAGAPGTDSFGNAYQVGVTSYLSGNVNIWSNLEAGLIQMQTDDGSTGANLAQNKTSFTALAQPSTVYFSPLFVGAAAAALRLWGQDSSATKNAMAVLYRTDNSTALDVIVQGTVKYGTITSDVPTAETWHALPLATNWANQGGFGTGAYKRMPDGTVRFSGAISWTAAASNAPVQVCTALPAAYRPITDKRCFVMSMPSDTVTPQLETLDIRADGTVWITSFANGTGPVTPITLEAVSYPLDH